MPVPVSIHAKRTTKVALALSLLALLVLVACRQATQMRVEAYTNVAHDAQVRLAFFSGPSLESLSAEPSAAPPVDWGQDGLIGSLVFAPPSNKPTAKVAIRTVLAIGRDPATCSAADAAGCIVADRTLSYSEGRSLRIPVGLFRQCAGVVCALGQTCNYEAQCVPAELDSAACATQDGCTIVGDPPSPPGLQSPSAPTDPKADAGDSGAAPTPLPPVLSMRDRDPRRGYVEGTLSVAGRAGSISFSRIELSYATPSGGAGEVFATLGASSLPAVYTFLAGRQLPASVSEVVAVAIADGLGGAPRVSAPTVLRVDNYPRLRDIGAGQGADIAYRAQYLRDESAPAKRLFVFGQDPSARPTVRRCDIDGSACVGRVLGPPSAYGYAALSLPITGRGAFVYADSAGHMYECEADASHCAERAYGDLGEAGGSSVSLVPDRSATGAFVVLVRVPGNPITTSTLHAFRCVVGQPTCAARQSQVPGFVAAPEVAADAAGIHLISYDSANLAHLVSCAPDGGACTSRPVSASPVRGAAVALKNGVPWVLGRVGLSQMRLFECAGAACLPQALQQLPESLPTDLASGLIFDGDAAVLFYYGPPRDLLAVRCAATCTTTKLSAMVGPQVNNFGSLHAVMDDAGLLRVGDLEPYLSPAIVRCNKALTSCAYGAAVAPELAGNTVGDGLDGVIDAEGKRLLVVTTNPSKDNQSTLFSCDLEGTACSAQDLTTSGLPDSAHAPDLLFDKEKRKLMVSVDDQSCTDERACGTTLLVCAEDGKGCTSSIVLENTQYQSGSPTSVVTRAQRTKGGRMRFFSDPDFGGPIAVLDCSAGATNCSRGFVDPDPDGDEDDLAGSAVSDLAYDPASDLSYLILGSDLQYPAGAAQCSADPVNGAAAACKPIKLQRAFADADTLTPLSVVVENGAPTFLTKVEGANQEIRVALIHCVDRLSCSKEILPIDVPQTYPDLRGAMVAQDARGARYVAIGSQDYLPLSLYRCTSRGCDLLYAFELAYLTPRFRLFTDATADRLYLVTRNDQANARPAALVLDLY